LPDTLASPKSIATADRESPTDVSSGDGDLRSPLESSTLTSSDGLQSLSAPTDDTPNLGPTREDAASSDAAGAPDEDWATESQEDSDRSSQVASETAEKLKHGTHVKQWRFDAWVDADYSADKGHWAEVSEPSLQAISRLRAIASKNSKLADALEWHVTQRHAFQVENVAALARKIKSKKRGAKLSLFDRAKKRSQAETFSKLRAQSMKRERTALQILRKVRAAKAEAYSLYQDVEAFESQAVRESKTGKEIDRSRFEQLKARVKGGLEHRVTLRSWWLVIRLDDQAQAANKVDGCTELVGHTNTVVNIAAAILAGAADAGVRVATFGILGFETKDRGSHHTTIRPNMGIFSDFYNTWRKASQIFQTGAMGGKAASGIYAGLLVLKTLASSLTTILGSLTLYCAAIGTILLIPPATPAGAVLLEVAQFIGYGGLGVLAFKVALDAVLLLWSSIAAARSKHRDPRKRKTSKEQAFKQAGDLAIDGTSLVAGVATAAAAPALADTFGGMFHGEKFHAKTGYDAVGNMASKAGFQAGLQAPKMVGLAAGMATKVGAGVASDQMSEEENRLFTALPDVDAEMPVQQSEPVDPSPTDQTDSAVGELAANAQGLDDTFSKIGGGFNRAAIMSHKLLPASAQNIPDDLSEIAESPLMAGDRKLSYFTNGIIRANKSRHV
jgi:hypothetical protein